MYQINSFRPEVIAYFVECLEKAIPVSQYQHKIKFVLFSTNKINHPKVICGYYVAKSCNQIWLNCIPICFIRRTVSHHGPLSRYVKLRVPHAPGMQGTFLPAPTPRVTDSYWSFHASRHVPDARAVMHVGITNPRWQGKRSRHSRSMRNPRFTYLVRGPWVWNCGMEVDVK